MNTPKLFHTQSELDDRIVKEKGLEGQDLLDKKVLSLQVELGELANEWQMFKFWKENPKPNTEMEVMKGCLQCGYTGERFGNRCYQCDGSGELLAYVKNPLLEEYVDCLHFILSIGNDLGIHDVDVTCDYTGETVTETFNQLFENVGDLHHCLKRETGPVTDDVYEVAFETLVGLGEQLGFTWEQIELAYYEKNEVNHERQDSGY